MSVWEINEKAQWPPSGKPLPPFGSTRIEIIRSCPLRDIFEASEGYEDQVGDAARIGIAFHRVLQSFVDEGLPQERDQRTSTVRSRFQKELLAQDEEKAKHPRERFLVRNEERISAALAALYTEANRFSNQVVQISLRKDGGSRDIVHPSPAHPQVAEIPVRSQDGIFIGRIDYAEYTSEGIRIIDYKSAIRNDVPDRYKRQLLLYAALWFETFGEWPVKATLVYPLTSMEVDIPLIAEDCQQVLKEARQFIDKLLSPLPVETKAIPGDVCKVCNFRPWCRPFWAYQENEKNFNVALERSRVGLQGRVGGISTIDQHWKLLVQWHNVIVKMIAPFERFPHLERVVPGMKVRMLNVRLHGQRLQPTVEIYDDSEIFIVNE